jgi:hypothetical protein
VTLAVLSLAGAVSVAARGLISVAIPLSGQHARWNPVGDAEHTIHHARAESSIPLSAVRLLAGGTSDI